MAISGLKLKLCAHEKTYSLTVASCERPYNDLGGPFRDLEPCIGWA